MRRGSGWIWLGIACVLAGCKPAAHAVADVNGVGREHIQTMQASVSRLTQGKNQGYELEISVENSRSLVMPIYFQSKGQFVAPDDKVARMLIDRWLKSQAEGIAVFGTIGMQFGQKAPFISLNLDEQ